MDTAQDMRVDMRHKDDDFLVALGGRAIARWDMPEGTDWLEVAQVHGLYPGSAEYKVGFPDPEDADAHLTVQVMSRSPFGKRTDDGKVVSQWFHGAYVFDGCRGIEDTGEPIADYLVTQVVTAVVHHQLEGWRP